MILVDTSIWVDHLRKGDRELSALLESDLVLTHPFVIGELALGRLKSRTVILKALTDLPHARAATDHEVLEFIDMHALAGSGLGYVDVHLLAAAKLTDDASLWTRDRRLQGAASRLRLSAH